MAVTAVFKYVLPSYPSPDSATGDWQREDLESLSAMQEFNGPDVASAPGEAIPLVPGVPLRHQRAVARLMSGASNVRSLMLVHQVGTGKTCSAVSSIERNLGDAMFGMRRGLVLLPNTVVRRNFIRELETSCTTRYSADASVRAELREDAFDTRAAQVPRRVAWKNYYTFDTFERFARNMSQLSDAEIAARWNSTFVVVDEAHSIGTPTGQRYLQIDRFLRALPNKKVLLMTGTPVRDSPADFALVFNLMQEHGQKLDVANFMERYLPPPARQPSQELVARIAGKVSYLTSDPADIEVVDAGETLPGKKTRIVGSVMSQFQADVYIQTLAADRQGAATRQPQQQDVAYLGARQSARFVFPDGSFGRAGYEKYMPGDRPSRDLIAALTTLNRPGEAPRTAATEAERYEAVSRYSRRYADLALSVLQAARRGEKSLVYDDLVRGSGLFVFAAVLEIFGARRGRDAGTVSYEVLTGDMSDARIAEIQASFNAADNARGRHLMCVMGSRVISVGLTFKDVLHEHVVAHWNDSETRQVIGRGIRSGSHKAFKATLPPGTPLRVTVYRRASLYPGSDAVEDSVDLLMYTTSEEKRNLIDAVVDAAKRTAITCRAFSQRNQMNPSQLDPATGLPWDNDRDSCSIPERLSPLTEDNAVATELWDRDRLREVSRALIAMRMGTLDDFARALREAGRDYDALVDVPYVLHLVRTGTVLNPDDPPTVPRLVVHDMDGVLYVSQGADLYGDSFMSQYTVRRVPGRGGSEQAQFEAHLTEFADRALADRLRRGDFPDTWEIPPRVMQTLIQDCLTTQILGPEMAPANTAWGTVNQVLEHYRDFWTGPTEIENVARNLRRPGDEPVTVPHIVGAVWYTAGVAGELDVPRVLYARDFQDSSVSAYSSWKNAEDDATLRLLVFTRDARRLGKERDARRLGLNHVGLVNPTTGDFCLSGLTSNVRNTGGRVDKRRLTVGRHCQYYPKPDLVRVATTLDPSLSPVEATALSRPQICERIATGYRNAGLTSLDMSCGVQNKRR